MPAYTVALTGGVASGKSEVERRFAALGVPVIDADRIARDLVRPGEPALEEIAAAFGPTALDASGALDRAAMREIVFHDERARARLNAILHPRVRDVLHERSAAATGPYVLLGIPLLVESGDYGWVDRVLLVDAPRELQRRRLVERDGVAPALADAMIAAQASREARLARADDVIVNDGAIEALDGKVRELDRRYRALAQG